MPILLEDVSETPGRSCPAAIVLGDLFGVSNRGIGAVGGLRNHVMRAEGISAPTRRFVARHSPR